MDTEILDRSKPYGGRLAVLISVHEQLQATPGFLRITVVCTPWGHLPYYDKLDDWEKQVETVKEYMDRRI